jgi:hypothetical protein
MYTLYIIHIKFYKFRSSFANQNDEWNTAKLDLELLIQSGDRSSHATPGGATLSSMSAMTFPDATVYISENLCSSRTSGWSLPGVMSDWQCCVDWLLAKYCRCKLQLDWCWCRWRTSVKGRCQWGLQVWSRQVGLVRGTRWPAGSSAGRMLARTTRQNRGWFLSWASKPRSSRDDVGAKSWVEIGVRSHQVREVSSASPQNH